MARANQKPENKFLSNKTNLAGGKAYQYPPKLELVMRCVNNFMEDCFYAKNSSIKIAIRNLVNEIGEKDPVYVMKLASWLRNEMNMRSVSIYLLALMSGHSAYKNKPKPWVINYGPSIMSRADESAEALASFRAEFPNEKIPQALKKAINIRLNQLTTYEAIKYRGKNRDWSLKDVIKVTHPKPTTIISNYLFNWIINEDLSIEDAWDYGLYQLASYLQIMKASNLEDLDMTALEAATWEILISKFGSNPESWQVASKVMPPMAYIRNLRNILYNKSDNMEIDYDKIVKAGKDHRVLPFRFLSAKKAIDNDLNSDLSKETKKVQEALEEAIELSVVNVPNLGNIAILIDKSGSMSSRLSNKTEISYSDVSKIFAASAFKQADNAIIIEYNYEAKVIKNINKRDRLFSIIDKMSYPSGGTSLASAMDLVRDYYIEEIDTLYILTDEQSYMPSMDSQQYVPDIYKYLLCKNPNLKIINHNISNYGTSDLPQDNRILHIGGWSDQIFNIIDVWRKGGMENIINNWNLNND